MMAASSRHLLQRTKTSLPIYPKSKSIESSLSILTCGMSTRFLRACFSEAERVVKRRRVLVQHPRPQDRWELLARPLLSHVANYRQFVIIAAIGFHRRHDQSSDISNDDRQPDEHCQQPENADQAAAR